MIMLNLKIKGLGFISEIFLFMKSIVINILCLILINIILACFSKFLIIIYVLIKVIIMFDTQ